LGTQYPPSASFKLAGKEESYSTRFAGEATLINYSFSLSYTEATGEASATAVADHGDEE